MPKLFIGIFATLVFTLIPNPAYAQQGCCSWHGGVDSCDTSVGRKVCGDGTYSPSCTCLYIPPTPTPKPSLQPLVLPPACKVPGEINPTSSIKPNYQNLKWTINVSWPAVDGATGYSVASDTNPYSDPGPLSDTATTYYTFPDLASGTRYVHIKPLNKCGTGTTKHLKFELTDITSIPKPSPVTLPVVQEKGTTIFEGIIDWFRNLLGFNEPPLILTQSPAPILPTPSLKPSPSVFKPIQTIKPKVSPKIVPTPTPVENRRDEAIKKLEDKLSTVNQSIQNVINSRQQYQDSCLKDAIARAADPSYCYNSGSDGIINSLTAQRNDLLLQISQLKSED